MCIRDSLSVEVVFLHASDEILLKRYSETRRRHPLDLGSVPLREAIDQERRLLEPIVACADLIIDTGGTNIYQLRELIRARIHDTPREVMSVSYTHLDVYKRQSSDRKRLV